jgi:hypothetical protein
MPTVFVQFDSIAHRAAMCAAPIAAVALCVLLVVGLFI